MKKLYHFSTTLLKKRPFVFFFFFLALLFILILIGNKKGVSQTEENTILIPPKEVSFFSFTETPSFTISGMIHNEGVVTIVAQTSGIVYTLRTSEGASISKGSPLLTLSENALGSNSATLSKEIASRSQEFQEENFDRRTSIPETQREELTPQTSRDEDKITRAQYKILEESILLERDLSRLQTEQAKINELRFFPLSPLSGLVEKIHVRIGDNVTMGTPLVTVSGTGKLTATALVPKRIASRINVDETFSVQTENGTIPITLRYISHVATNNTNVSLLFELPDSLKEVFTNKEFVSIMLPLENISSDTFLPLIPIDAVHITQENSFVFINDNGIARAQIIQTGEVLGSYVIVKEGLDANMKIILDRQVIDGDAITETL